MTFKVLVENANGDREVVHEIHGNRVTRVGLTGSQGEAAGMRVDFGVGEVVLTFEQEINAGDRPTLHEVEAQFAPETVHPAEDSVDEVASEEEVGEDSEEEVAASEVGEESQEGSEGSTETPPTEDGGTLSLGSTS